jgi:hypothetical protein
MNSVTLHPSPATTQPGLRRSTPKEILSAYAALFASVSTLVCCALPALLVLVGFGLTSVLTFFTAIPGWQKVALYTPWLFLGGAILLATGFYFSYFHRSQPGGEVCEIPVGSKESACSTVTRWNRRILWLSLLLYGMAIGMDTWGIGWMRAHGYFNR